VSREGHSKNVKINTPPTAFKFLGKCPKRKKKGLTQKWGEGQKILEGKKEGEISKNQRTRG